MLRWVLGRCLWMVPTLLGITFATFVLLDLAPLDRARLELLQLRETGASPTAQDRDLALLRLQVRYGLRDERTLQLVPVWQRYWRWLESAAAFELAGPDEDQAQFRRRLAEAVPVSLLLGFWSLVVTFGLGVPIGCWLGMRAGSRGDRLASAVLFVAIGLPEVLVATLLLVAFGGVWLRWFPDGGLRSDGAEHWSLPVQLLDLGWHLALPVVTMALPSLLLVVRFLRESTSRAANAPFAHNLEAWGIEPALVRRRLLRAGCAPLATLSGSLLPLLFSGSVVVETVFSLHGVGRLAWAAVGSHDQAMVMALTLLISVVTLLALVASDLLHRLVDPRVRLAS